MLISTCHQHASVFHIKSNFKNDIPTQFNEHAQRVSHYCPYGNFNYIQLCNSIISTVICLMATQRLLYQIQQNIVTVHLKNTTDSQMCPRN